MKTVVAGDFEFILDIANCLRIVRIGSRQQWDTKYTVGSGAIALSQRINSLVPVERLIDKLKHANIAILFLGVDYVGHPLEPFDRTIIVIVAVEPTVGAY
jgi:hypothetical protein